MFTRIDPLVLLERADKWYVGGGSAAVWAPAFPKYVDTPGFWDEAYYADIRLERLFAITLIDERSRPVPLHRAVRRWAPDRLTQIYTLEGFQGLQLREERVITPGNTLACRFTLSTSDSVSKSVRMNLLMWTMQQVCDIDSTSDTETATSCAHAYREQDLIGYTHRIRYGAVPDTPADVYGWGSARTQSSEYRVRDFALFVAFGADRLPDSGTINLAEATETAPLYNVSVFPEKFRNGTLAQEHQVESGWNPNGALHMALHYTMEALPNSPDVLTVGACIGMTRDGAEQTLRFDMSTDVPAVCRESWTRYFESVPYLECSDPFIQKYYWYRWYGLKLLTVDMGKASPPDADILHRLPHPCVFEGIGGFRSHISYSAQCHMRETAWMKDRSLSMGCLENFIANQNTDADSDERGFLPGHTGLWQRTRGFYHADWGAASLQLYRLTNDTSFVRRVYPGLARYAEYFDRERDREGSGLYDILDQGETGQEYMSRYLFVDAKADEWRPIQIKGVDATCYLYSLYSTLSLFADMLNIKAESARWKRLADKTRQAVRDVMWDEERGLFKDVDPDEMTQSTFSAAVGFYPLMTDIALPSQLPVLLAHLANPHTFGSNYPLPACSIDDPYFDAAAAWKGKRTNCPWNGRVWPMTSSHVADGLANAARTLSRTAAPAAVDFINRFVRMLFFDGDVDRPNCFEHYNPFAGTPSLYRGVDDYQHSWIVDLIMRHVAGIQPAPGPHGGLVIDPLPFGIERLKVECVAIRGHTVDVRWGYGDGFVVSVDGVDQAILPQPQCIELEITP